MQLRVARHTEQLDEVVSFYRDGVGLAEIGGFRDHDGYDGVFLAVPGTGAHLELTAGGGRSAPEPSRVAARAVSRRRTGRAGGRGAPRRRADPLPPIRTGPITD